jgi:hypothetical protein
MSTDPTRSDAMNHKSKLVTNHFDRQLECSCGFRTRIADGFALSIFDIEDEFRAHLPAPVADAAPANLHQQIMNIPADKRPVGGSRACDEAYLFGHRDARHAAAELASAAVADAAPASEARIAEAVRALESQVAECPDAGCPVCDERRAVLAILTGRAAKA